MVERTFAARQLIVAALSCLMACLMACPALYAQAVDTRTATNNINYAFSSELGSGVYELDGRIMQVYRLPLWWNLRDTTQEKPGLRFVMPTTFGFFDFTSRDVLEGDLPSNIGSFSIMPGLELDYLAPRGWHFVPYLMAGTSFADNAEDGWLVSTGARLQRTSQRGVRQTIRLHDMSVAMVDYRGDSPNDWFVRQRNGIELRRVDPVMAGVHRWVAGAYAILDLVPDPPHTGTDAEAGFVQFEAGLTIGLNPMPKLFGYDLPRLGIGYRLAGDFPGWRLVIGAPF